MNIARKAMMRGKSESGPITPIDVYGYSDCDVYTVFKSTWAQARDASVGDGTAPVGQPGLAIHSHQPGIGGYWVGRAFIMYDLSGLSGEVTNASLFLVGWGLLNSEISVLQGTQEEPLTVNDYTAFGSEYASKQLVPGYNEIVLNEQAITDINAQIGVGMMKFCLREREHDYLDVSPGAGEEWDTYILSSDDSGDTHPYLSLS